jgi:hypothetical protein
VQPREEDTAQWLPAVLVAGLDRQGWLGAGSNHELAEHLELAVANIQRLTLENHRLRQQLETATKVTHIDRRPR